MEVVSSEYRVKTVLSRLERIIDNENERIGKDPEFDFKVSNAHKSRCLYELTMLFRGTNPQEFAVNHIEQMHALKAKLTLNARRVEAHGCPGLQLTAAGQKEIHRFAKQTELEMAL